MIGENAMCVCSQLPSRHLIQFISHSRTNQKERKSKQNKKKINLPLVSGAEESVISLAVLKGLASLLVQLADTPCQRWKPFVPLECGSSKVLLLTSASRASWAGSLPAPLLPLQWSQGHSSQALQTHLVSSGTREMYRKVRSTSFLFPFFSTRGFSGAYLDGFQPWPCGLIRCEELSIYSRTFSNILALTHWITVIHTSHLSPLNYDNQKYLDIRSCSLGPKLGTLGWELLGYGGRSWLCGIWFSFFLIF